MIGFRLEMNPSGLETPLGVPCQCCRRCLLVGVKKDPEPHHDLKAVADTQDQSILGLKHTDHLGQPCLPLNSRDPPRSDVIAIAKSARKAEDLKGVGKARVLDQLIDVDPNRFPASQFKGVSRLDVAIGSWCSDNERFWLGHPDRVSAV